MLIFKWLGFLEEKNVVWTYKFLRQRKKILFANNVSEVDISLCVDDSLYHG